MHFTHKGIHTKTLYLKLYTTTKIVYINNNKNLHTSSHAYS